MNSKKIKINDVNTANFKTIKQLGEIIDKEDIVLQQKYSIFLQMIEYKKINREIMERNEELVRENSMLMNALENSRQNKENSDNNQGISDGISEFGVDSKVAELNREIRKLTITICELEKSILRKEICGGDSSKNAVEKAVEDRNDVYISDNLLKSDEIYKDIVEDAAELKSKLATLKNDCKQELTEKQLEIDKVTQEMSSCNSELQEAKEKCRMMEIEIGEYKKRIEENNARNIESKKEMEACNAKIAELERSVRFLTSDMGLKESRIAQLASEKEEQSKLLDNYSSYERKEISADKKAEESFLEEEIGNLVESLDKSLSENKSLLRKLEEVHEKNGKLEGEVMGLKISNSELASQNSKLELEMKDLKREIKNCLSGGAEDSSTKIKALEEAVEEKSKSISEYRKRLYKLSMEKDAVENALESNKKQNKGMKEELSKSVKKAYSLEVENRKINEIMKSMKGASSGDSDVFVQFEKYRSLLRCSLCDSRFKDTAITKCMHCFCEECINVRVKMRDRKCPSCNESFSTGDIKKIYL